MISLKKSIDEEHAADCLVVGTEDSLVYVFDTPAYDIREKVC